MPQRDSFSSEHPTIPVRRSLRLLSKDRAAEEDPKTPTPKSRTKRIHHSDPPSLSLAQKGSLKKTQKKRCPEEVSKEFDELECGSKTTEKSSTGSRRSVRSNKVGLSDGSKAGVDSDTRKHAAGKAEKRATRSSVGGNTTIRKEKCNGLPGSAQSEVSEKKALSDVEIAKVNANSRKRFGDKSETTTKAGVKRKRDKVDGRVQDWSKDQELALHRAYFASKPTPHFWKKVAKLVPGKSAQDCFDKVHSNLLTPPQPRTRSRTSKTDSSPFSLSPFTLLKSSEPKIRRPKSSHKQKSHLVQKTVRQMLQRHYNVDQGFEADLFSVFESTSNPSRKAFQQGVIFSTPTRQQEKPECLKRCSERSSSSAHKKPLSRLSSPHGATLVSPPVLKQVKNKALHEKYIDQLHCREAKRNAASARAVKSVRGKENRKESYVQKLDAIKAAKNALVFDAKDVIHQFQHLRARAQSDFSDCGDSGIDEDDDGCEAEP